MQQRSSALFATSVLCLLVGCATVEADVNRETVSCESELKQVVVHMANAGYMPAYVDELLSLVDESRQHVAKRPFAEPVPDLAFSGVYVWSAPSGKCTMEITPRRDLANGQIEALRVKLSIVKATHGDVIAAMRELLRLARLPDLQPEALRAERYHWDDIVYDSEREMHIGFGVDFVPVKGAWRGSLEIVRGGAITVTQAKSRSDEQAVMLTRD